MQFDTKCSIALFHLVLTIVSFSAHAAIKLPQLVNNHMVLQRDVKLKIWGWGSIGEKVSVSFNGKNANAITGTDGKWVVTLPAMPAGGPYVMVIKSSNEIKLTDILIGDVWFCSGQSNMALPMSAVKEKYPDDITKADYPEIRNFHVAYTTDLTKVHDDFLPGEWTAATPQSVLNFGAVTYFFARNIYLKHHVPIGLINASVIGTIIEAWINPEGFKHLPRFDRQIKNLADPIYMNGIKKDKAGVYDFSGKDYPTGLYNTMVSPAIKYAIKGFLWYQGETNVSRGNEYRRLLPALINGWRNKWQLGNLPFIYVQLPNYMQVKNFPSESQWAQLRQSQLQTLSVANTGMAVTIDIGSKNELHPADKKDVGDRLSLWAEYLAYNNKSIVHSGPIYQSYTIDNNKMILSFNNIGSGLLVKGSGDLNYFSIAGADKKYVWARAKIAGDKVIVWSNIVLKPVSVRYAWADNPEGANLYNKEGLPASPFQIDNPSKPSLVFILRMLLLPRI